MAKVIGSLSGYEIYEKDSNGNWKRVTKGRMDSKIKNAGAKAAQRARYETNGIL